MSSGDLLPEPETPRRGRPPGPRKAPRRNYVTELAQLEGRVKQAAFLLKKAGEPDAKPEVVVAMLKAAMETLEGV